MLDEIPHFALPIALVATGLLVALVLSWLGDRTALPGAVLLLLAGSIAATAVPGLREHVSILTVERIAVLALIVILLSGGLDIGAGRLRESSREVTLLGIAGTFLTAAALAVAAHLILGLPWKVAGLVGAALAPTDPAVVFSVLGRREITGRAGTVLEGEAGMNDPAGIALLLGLLEVATSDTGSIWNVAATFLVEMGIGGAIGFAGGLLMTQILGRVRLPSGGEHAVLTIVCAVALYGATTLAGGSGFLAVFIAGLVLSDVTVPHHGDIDRFIGGLASLAELTVFLVLGLTIDLTLIPAGDWLAGVAIAAVMMVVVRPLVAGLLLWRSSLDRGERRFVALAGLKGAVPILLGAFAVLGAAPSAERIYHLVFVVVLVSVAAQGTALALLGERIGVTMAVVPARPWELSLRLPRRPAAHHLLTIEPGSPAEGRRLDALAPGTGSWPTLVLRDEEPIAARPELVLRAGDVLRIARDEGFAELAAATRAPRAR